MAESCPVAPFTEQVTSAAFMINEGPPEVIVQLVSEERKPVPVTVTVVATAVGPGPMIAGDPLVGVNVTFGRTVNVADAESPLLPETVTM